MSFDIIYRWAGDWLKKKSPGWLLKKIYPTKKLLEEIDINISTNHLLDLPINGEIPSFDLFLMIHNLSLINIKVHKIIVDIWMGQPLIKYTVDRFIEIKNKSKTKDIYTNTQFNELHLKMIKRQIKQTRLPELTIQVEVFFESPLGSLSKHERFPRVSAKIPENIQPDN